VLFVAFLAVALFFVRRSFYGMRIDVREGLQEQAAAPRAIAAGDRR
jgi:hypothetical protein